MLTRLDLFVDLGYRHFPMKRIAPVQGLTFLFLLGLFLLTFIFKNLIPLWRSQLLFYVLLLGLLFVLKLSSDRNRSKGISGLLNEFSPVAFIILIYQSLGNMIQYLQPDVDPYLIRIDLFLFGVHPTVWMERWITPWFTDLMSFAYISYYFLPVILAITLYLKGQRDEFDQVMFVLTLGYYLSFIGYILLPAIGPRFTLDHLQTLPLGGSFFTDFVRDLLNSIEHNKRDCMPSGHTQIALMVLFLAHRYVKTIFYILLPVVCGLILSTVYLRYHYVIDLMAGIALAIACVFIGPRLHRWWLKNHQ
ncbi:MAG: inositol phosphorylceramide synthase [Deltaproteobacteria bacterium]|nr:inositol phosphorylceramide synthase [Deltaproteobacteria bacterium]